MQQSNAVYKVSRQCGCLYTKPKLRKRMYQNKYHIDIGAGEQSVQIDQALRHIHGIL